ncbi:HD domain-containing phosphohydrolase [Pseudomonas oryzae]|uniref:Putative two-component system response regulator n=1 Tax=Pseudomonas oryzae TaxID=1392877 RepID=A0A1H1RSX6_9PSED|nr:HD domain-containing phosphohydrolase [Pseudomonas oryzae]SDS38793.1 putative two-component system response regulator [Pseudomonas oryzae]
MRDIPEHLRKANVVLLEAVDGDLAQLATALHAAGLKNARVFSGPTQGLPWLLENPWDLLLLDLEIARPGGLEILSLLRKYLPESQPIIAVASRNDVDSRRRALDLGVSDYLNKSVDPQELLLRVRNHLSLWFARIELDNERRLLEQRVEERTREVQRTTEMVIRCLVRVTEYRDNQNGHHMIRIGETAALLARAYGCPPQWVKQLRLAATMHDVGMVGIPDRILLKPGPLDEEETQVMQQHTALGHQFLSDSSGNPLLKLAAEIARYHHERWDGSGYPQGLKGEEIPLSARIVALCDVYDALRAERPFKPAWSAKEAQLYIREQSGRHFDPELVGLMDRRMFEGFENLRMIWSD